MDEMDVDGAEIAVFLYTLCDDSFILYYIYTYILYSQQEYATTATYQCARDAPYALAFNDNTRVRLSNPQRCGRI